MLTLVEQAAEKRTLQADFHDILTNELTPVGSVRVGFKGGNIPTDLFVHEASGVWYGYNQIHDAKIPRSWNVFGYYHPEYHSQVITAEINIASENNGAQVAGYFAKDDRTGRNYLMHSGKIGGGLKGVGQKQFLAWLGKSTVAVKSGNGSIRQGLVVTELSGPQLVSQVVEFVSVVRGFKDFVRSEDYSPQKIQTIVNLQAKFSDEYSGVKKGQRPPSFDYYTYHGVVVRALREWRRRHSLGDENVANSGLIDLFVQREGNLTEVYEVKTSLDRQSLYTAIGQVCVHGADAAKSIVIPDGFDLASDINRAVTRLDIRVIRYAIDLDGICRIKSRFVRR